MAMEAESSHEAADKVLFTYSPEASFTRTIGWLFVGMPLIGVVAAGVDLFTGQAIPIVLITAVVSVGLCGALYLASRSVDRVQERIRIEVLSTGVLRFRNVIGRVREVPLRRAKSFDVKDLRGKPKIVNTKGEGGSRRRNPFAGDVEFKGRAGDRRSPHFTEISVRDSTGKRHVVTLSGAMPTKEVRKLSNAIDAVRSD